MCIKGSNELERDTNINLNYTDLDFCKNAQRMYNVTYDLYLDYDVEYKKAMEVFYTLDLSDSLRFSGLRVSNFTIEDKLLVLNREFIFVIADFFNNKYSLSLNIKYVKDLIISEKYSGKIDYTAVIQKIYDILGISDFKTYCISQVYNNMQKFAVPNFLTNEPQFEIKGEKLYIYGDFVTSNGDDDYTSEYYTISERLKFVLNALQLFETKNEFFNSELDKFYFEEKDVHKCIFLEFVPKTLSKIDSLKLYINGKFTITFINKILANDFVEMFLK